MLRDVGDTRPPADELTRFAAMSFGEEAERLTSGDDVERHLERAAVRFAAAHWERADRAQEETDDRRLEELALPHVADGVTERELDPRRVFPGAVVRGTAVGA